MGIFEAFNLRIPDVETMPRKKIRIDELLEYDEEFKSCIENTAKQAGIPEDKIRKTLKKATVGSEKHIRKIKELISDGRCLL